MNRRELIQKTSLLGLFGAVPVVFADAKATRIVNARRGSESASDNASGITPLVPPAHGSIPVAFVISEGAAIVDFCGPREVFENTNVPGRTEDAFRLYTVAKTTDTINASSRELLKPFNTQGITPAAGYTSTVQDLAKFASWQFRLLRTGKPDVLKASTLREMQRVQFLDPGWKTSWGLGFAIQRRDNHTYVGHAGDCPGYHTVLMLRPEDELGVVLMDNAADRAAVLAPVVFAILDKRKGYEFKGPAPAAGVDLEAYAGHYSGQPWVAESVMLPWAGGLVSLSLPNNDPVTALEFFKPKGGDIFREVREDGSEAEELKFTRDASGKVTGYIQSSNLKLRMTPD